MDTTMPLIELQTTKEVMDALGGIANVMSLTGSKYSAVSNWQNFIKFPSKTYVVMIAALRERGYTAPASLWGMIEKPQARDEPAEAVAS